MSDISATKQLSAIQLLTLVFLRIAIGWYFLYEGLAKIFIPAWSSQIYLTDSKGLFAPIFKAITEIPTLLHIVDQINIYGQILIGLSLVLGFLSKIGNIGGITLLVLYYLSHPPLINVNYLMPSEGSYMWVDKNMIILLAMLVLVFFPTSKVIGLDRIQIK